jgi:hypothetical protein
VVAVARRCPDFFPGRQDTLDKTNMKQMKRTTEQGQMEVFTF